MHYVYILRDDLKPIIAVCDSFESAKAAEKLALSLSVLWQNLTIDKVRVRTLEDSKRQLQYVPRKRGA